MRRYQKQTGELKQVICNCCGRELNVEQGILKEGACHLEPGWGYFSGKDMEKHSFDLCEACYDKIISGIFRAGGCDGGDGTFFRWKMEKQNEWEKRMYKNAAEHANSRSVT